MTFLLVGIKVKDFINNKHFIKDFTMDFTNFYGFVKKMVQKNQYTYNVPPGSSILTLTARREAIGFFFYRVDLFWPKPDT